MRTNFKDENHESEREYKIYRTITKILKSVDTIVIIGTTSSSVTLYLMGTGLIVLCISTGIACGITISDKVFFETILQKNKKYKKQYEKHLQTT